MALQTSPNLIKLGNCVVDVDMRTVRTGDKMSRLAPLQARILSVLIEASPEFVAREELLAQAWQVNSLSEQAVNSAISKLRAEFDDTSNAPWLIQTERNRGYRLLVTPEVVEQGPARRSFKRFWPAALLAAVALTASVWLVLRSPSMEDWLSNPPENWDVQYDQPAE